MVTRYLLATGVLLLSAAAAQAQNRSPISCSVSGGKKLDSGAIEVSNLTPISVVAEIATPENRNAQEWHVEVVVRSTAKSIVPSQTNWFGTDGTPGKIRFQMDLSIPIPAEQRKEAIENYIKQVETVGRQQGQAKETAALELMHDGAVAFLERLYSQNQTGTFQLVCRSKLANRAQRRQSPLWSALTVISSINPNSSHEYARQIGSTAKPL